MRHFFWQNSRCLNKYLHRFIIVKDYDDGVLEKCEVCRKSKGFKIIEGKLDNARYMSWHIRSALTPDYPYFDREYKYEPLLGK